jgi:predicted Co/Zn/Cd cation transporter (cation efflux family)
MDTTLEQAQLRFSIAVTLLVGASSIATGLFLRSQSIAFDGFYSLVDVVLTTGSLAVSRLIAQDGSRRFQFGYWHLEPLVVVLNATVLTTTCAYAAITAVHDLSDGGHEIRFGIGAAWAALIGVFSMIMALNLQRKARTLGSALLNLDAKGWFIGASISIAVLIGFGIAALIRGGRFDHFTPYIDSSVLLLLTITLLPLPMGSLWQAMREVLQLAPNALDQQVQNVMRSIVSERGYLDFASYVAKIGRMRFIDIHILLAPDAELGTIASIDDIRADIAARLGGDIRAEWLNIMFTSKRAWM